MNIKNRPVYDQTYCLSVLSHAEGDKVKALAEDVLPALGPLDVLINRTGLVMLPYTDTTTGTIFHLGEVLVAEAHIRLASGIEGYGMCLGRDLVQALAVAVLDAALSADQMTDAILAFVRIQAETLEAEDENILRAVESTRVEMETF